MGCLFDALLLIVGNPAEGEDDIGGKERSDEVFLAIPSKLSLFAGGEPDLLLVR